MKRKVISTLFALVLVCSLSLVMATPAEAAVTRNVIPYTLGATGGNAAVWSTAQAKTGSSSVNLTHVGGASIRAYVTFAPPAGITLAEFVAAPATYGFSYWRTEDKIGPQLELTFTDGADGWVELTAEVALYDYTTDDDLNQWIDKTLSGTEQCQFFGDDSADASFSSSGLGDLSDLITDIAAAAAADDAAAVGAWEMTKVLVDLGWSGDTQVAYVDDVIVDGTTYDLEGTAADYTTIQSAINAASADDTITVSPGTYLEDITISTANLTLESVADAATTTIRTAGSPNDIVQVWAADVTIDGFTIQGLGVASGAVNGIDVRGSGFTIQNNVFVDIYHDNIYLGDAGVAITSGLIDLNTFTGMGTSAAAYRPAINVESGANAISGVTVSNNVVSAYGGTESAGIQVAETTGAVSAIIVSDNEISSSSFGIATWNDGAATFTGNTVTGCDVGVDIYGDVGTLAPAFTLSGNTITTSTSYGIRVRTDANDLTGAGIVIRYNNITGNGDGVSVACSGTVNSPPVAENNWWGNASGPADAVKLAATGYTAYGDSVSADVDYEPWLLAVVVTGVPPTTYDKTLALKDEWTLVSPDKEVTTGTTWVGTTVLSGTDTILAYKYTPGTGFPQVTMATLLTSVDAYYIKTDSGGGVGINYSTSSPGVVTKTLVAGWNIISCAGETDAYTILNQLRHVQIGEQEGTGLTSLVGQGSYNQFTASISKTLVTDNEWLAITPTYTQLPLSAFDGYWVYMNAGKSFGVIPD